jgi:stearoyl-CoA desaturase (delta-9 desaturase)|tara:strand:+ start:14521 stop:15720 length:1200 start_codon:yes stop_codon:yes gene_type:complete
MQILNGLLEWSLWQEVLFVIASTHLTIVSVTLYLHRCQAHRALDLHPLVSHVFRLWLWLTTAMVTRQWVAVHRKHHAKTETAEDPHSPQVLGIGQVMTQGAELYARAARDPEISREYGHGAPNDFIERQLYSRYSNLGIILLLVAFVALFGAMGLTYWAIQMIWIPIFAAGFINGVGHYWGYRNFETEDAATNLMNVAFVVGGEELHNNHHAYPGSAKFSIRPWEFDLGWGYIWLLKSVGLASVRKVAPRPLPSDAASTALDIEAVSAMVSSRLHVMADYAQKVTLPILQKEMRLADGVYKSALNRIKKTLILEPAQVSHAKLHELNEVLADSEQLRVVYECQQQLKQLWRQRYENNEGLLRALAAWCQMAEQTGIEILQDFAQSLRGYRLQPVYNYAK